MVGCSDQHEATDDIVLPDLIDRVRDWARMQHWAEDDALEEAGFGSSGAHQAIDYVVLARRSGLFDEQQIGELQEVQRLGRLLDTFLPERRLGSGAFGAVYLATVRSSGQRVALKVLHLERDQKPECRLRFEREAAALASLDHPSIPALVDYSRASIRGDKWTSVEAERQAYLAMDYVEGVTLGELMRRFGRLPEGFALWAVAQVARGLQHAEERVGLIHRDIKPDNIIVRAPDDVALEDLHPASFPVMVLDFGLAKGAGLRVAEVGTRRIKRHGGGGTEEMAATREGRIVGTPNYMAPEQIRDEELDWRCDLYALGGTLYHLLTGDPPFQGCTTYEVIDAHLKREPPDPRDVRPDLSARSAIIIARALAKDRDQRHGDYRAFIEACERAVAALDDETTVAARLLDTGTNAFGRPHGDLDPTREMAEQPGAERPTTNAVQQLTTLAKTRARQGSTRRLRQTTMPIPRLDRASQLQAERRPLLYCLAALLLLAALVVPPALALISARS